MLFQNSKDPSNSTFFVFGDIQVLHQKSKRKSISISVNKEGNVSIKTPFRTSQTKVFEVLKQKRDWIDKAIQKQKEAKKIQKIEKINLAKKQEVYLFGKKYKIVELDEQKNDLFSNAVGFCGENLEEGFKLEDFWHQNFKILEVEKQILISEKLAKFQDKINKLKTLFEKILELYLELSVQKYLQKLKISTSYNLQIKDYKSKWGSCKYQSPRSKIPFFKAKIPKKVTLCFNFSLIFLNPEIVDYIVAHEVCHILQANHSSKFWREVERIYPNYKEARKWLRLDSAKMVASGYLFSLKG
jgi:predicted metal-dependent hydrolase